MNNNLNDGYDKINMTSNLKKITKPEYTLNAN